MRAINVPRKRERRRQSFRNVDLSKHESLSLFRIFVEQKDETVGGVGARDEKQVAQKRFPELGKTAGVRLPSSNLLCPRFIPRASRAARYVRINADQRGRDHTRARARMHVTTFTFNAVIGSLAAAMCASRYIRGGERGTTVWYT